MAAESEPLIALADEIVAYLREHSFSQEIIVERSYSPAVDVTDLENPHVNVIPVEIDEENLTRSKTKGVLEDWVVHLALQQKLDHTANAVQVKAQMDGLMRLAREIKNTLQRVNYDMGQWNAKYLKCKTLTPYSMSQYNVNDIYTSALELTYKGLD